MKISETNRKLLSKAASLRGVRPGIDRNGVAFQIDSIESAATFRMMDDSRCEFELKVPWDLKRERVSFQAALGEALSNDEVLAHYKELVRDQLSKVFSGTSYCFNGVFPDGYELLFSYTATKIGFDLEEFEGIVSKLRVG